jgi:uncharacterized protein YnzC (UPF0291/DUF896 family)
MFSEVIKKEEAQSESSYWSTERVNELLRKIDEEGLDYKEVDNPFHDQNPDLKKPNLLWEYTNEEILEMRKCAEDVTYFAKYCQVMTDEGLNYIKLRDYQSSVLREYQANRFNIFLAPRQVGKCLLNNSQIIDTNGNNISINKLKPSNNITILEKCKSLLYYLYNLL